MKAEVDKSLCVGHALCWREAPDVFPLDDEGYNELGGQGPVTIAPEHEEAARDGASWCPEQAIQLSE